MPLAVDWEMRNRYHSLLQVAGTISVIVFHSGMRAAQGGWIAVEVFFALAGYNMFRSSRIETGWVRFLASRYRRFIGPVLLVTPVVGYLVFVYGLQSATGFLYLAPVMLQNTLPLAGTNWRGGDVAWIPLWFLAALFQLQILVFFARRALSSRGALTTVIGIIIVGLASRFLLWTCFTQGSSFLSPSEAARVFWSPFAHIEAFCLGALVALRRTEAGRLWGPLVLITAAAGAAQIIIFGSDPWTFGYPAGMPGSMQFLWGYTILGLVAASLVDPANRAAILINALKIPSRVDSCLNSLSQVSIYAYAIHGSIWFMLWTRLPVDSRFNPHGSIRHQVAANVLCIFLSFGLSLALQRILAAAKLVRSPQSSGSAP